VVIYTDELLIIAFGSTAAVALSNYLSRHGIRAGSWCTRFCLNQMLHLVRKWQKSLILFSATAFFFLSRGPAICLLRTMGKKFTSLIRHSSQPDGRTKDRRDCGLSHVCYVRKSGAHMGAWWDNCRQIGLRAYRIKQKACKVFRKNVCAPQPLLPTALVSRNGRVDFFYYSSERKLNGFITYT